MDKGYLDLNSFFKERFGEKVHKLSLTLYATCPNRDGTLSTKGCIFCSENGSGDFLNCGTLHEQVQLQIKRVKRKHPKAKKFVAYFQNFSNTYGDVAYLESSYVSLLEFEEIVAISIGTRADCIHEDILGVLEELSKKIFVYIEIGLQSIHTKSREWLEIGYSIEIFKWAVNSLKTRGIEVVAHLIFGIPGESREEMLESVRFLNSQKIWGVKFHHFYVAKGTALATLYESSPFELLSEEHYMKILIQSIETIEADIVVHRLSSDPDKRCLIAPIWSSSKIEFLNQFQKRHVKT
ncbi:MAG: TIGR01212 family radical SAM protein [Fusobacteria bacterium]|nr:TIGR01212 family radical SAM protein [Fusobacteriota bacterium]